MSNRHPLPVCALAALVGLLGACSTDLKLPDGADLTCQSDGDCPGRLLCRVSTGRCVEPSTNEPPTVVVGTIQRSTATVSIPLTAVDPEGDDATLAVTADLGDGTFQPITVDPATIEASAAGVTTTVVWDAAADLGGGAAYHEGLRVRLVPSDARGEGTAVTSEPFAYGNEPPVLAGVTLDDATVSGVTVLRFTVSDGASDPVRVTRFELSPSGDFSDAVAVALTGGPDGNFPSGALEDLSATPAGVSHSLTWNSALAGAVARPSARVRLWVADEPFGAESEPAASAAFELRNQTPPRVEPVFVKADGALHNGLVPITYLLIDAEGDAADVLFEFSVDEGLTWSPCSEATLPASEGVEALAASRDGVAHTWIWDSSANVALFAQSVRVRATASGAASGPGPSTPLVQQRPVGLATGAGRELLFADPVRQVSSESSPHATVADLNGDGIGDLASVSLFGQLRVRLGAGAGGVWSGSFGPPTTYALVADGGAVAAGDVTCDGVVDLVTVTNGNSFSATGHPGAVQLWTGAGNGTFAELAGSPIPLGAQVDDLHLADLEGDGDLDVVMRLTSGAARVLFNAGAAQGCGFGEVVNLAGGGVWTLGVGDLDADGLKDVVFANGRVYHGTPAASGGRFAEGTQVPGLAAAGVQAVTLADVDGDGDDDVVGAGLAARSDGAGGFDASATFPRGAGPHGAVTFDVNGDGLLDLLTVNFEGGDVTVHVAVDRGGTWEGGFVEAFSIPLSFGLQPNHLELADLDRDGRPDLVVADRSAGVETLLSVSRSAFDASSLKGAQVFPTEQFESANLFPADFDLDGVADLMVSGFGGSLVFGSRAGRAPAGLFLPGEHLTFRDDVALPAAGDFDRDGFFDLVTIDPTISNDRFASVGAQLFRGQPRQGGATFVPATAPPLTSAAQHLGRCVAALHVNGDAWLDVLAVTSSSSAANAYTFFGSATGDFTAGPVTSLGGAAYGTSRCELADLDGDGVLDLAGPNGSLWRVLPSGALVAFGAVPAGSAFTLTDLDRDGIVDVLTSSNAPTVEVRRGGGAGGVGNGTFTLLGTVGGFSGNVRDLEAVDVDGDGLLDLVATTAQRTVAVALGRGTGGVGDGTFSTPVEAASPTADVSMETLLDANGDLVPDVAAVDLALNAPKALTVVTAMRTAVAPAWRVRVGAGQASALLGADTAPLEQNLLGVPLGGSFTRLPFTSGRVGFIDHARGSIAQSNLFPQLLRGSGLAGVPQQLVPLTLPWTWSGARSLARVADPDGVLRLEVRERFGPRLAAGRPQRAGLSLAGGVQRGVIVELPLLAGRAAVDGKIRVYLRTLDYTRASEWPGDALSGTADGDGYLPVEGGEDVVHPRFSWTTAVQVADLAAGTGPRFVVDRTRSPAVIRVALDAEATLQAFAVP